MSDHLEILEMRNSESGVLDHRSVSSAVPATVPPLVSVQGTAHGLGLFANDGDGHHVTGQQRIIIDETKNYINCLDDDEDEDSDCGNNGGNRNRGGNGEPLSKKTRGRVKIKMEFIQNKLRRYTTFSKRKTGIMKKAYELSTLTGTQVMLLVASETGHVYTFATRKLQPMITSESGKALIQTCLNSPDPSQFSTQTAEQRMSQTGYEEPDLQYTTNEDGTKCNLSPSSQTPLIGLPLGQTGQSFPMTTYIAPPTPQPPAKPANLPVTYSVQSVAGGNLTTIFTPANGTLPQHTALQIQPIQQQQHQQPTNQVLSGQLQLHRIHPHNILLTGNSTNLQSGQIIINQPHNNGSSLPVVIASDHTNQTTQHVVSSTNTQSNNDQDNVITIVQPNNTDHTFATNNDNTVQMVYNQNGNVLYATPIQTVSNNDHRESSVSNSVAVHHPTIIHTSTGTYQIQQDGTTGLLDHHTDGMRQIVDGTFVIPSDPHNDLSKQEISTSSLS